MSIKVSVKFVQQDFTFESDLAIELWRIKHPLHQGHRSCTQYLANVSSQHLHQNIV